MKFYQKMWFIILMLIIVPPFSIFLMWKYTGWNKKAKGVVTIPMAIYSIILVATLFSQSVIPGNIPSYSISGISEVGVSSNLSPKREKSQLDELAVIKSTKTPQVNATPDSSSTIKPTQTPKPTKKPTVTLKPTKKPVSTPKPTKKPDKETRTVYVTETGEKYHYKNPCGRGTYYKSTLEDAIESGLEPCKKCVL